MNGKIAMSSAVAVNLLPTDTYLEMAEATRLQTLAAIVHGDFDPPSLPWPQVHSGLRPFEAAARVEVWHTRRPPSYEEEDGFQIASTEDLVFAAANAEQSDAVALSSLVEDLYLRLLRILESRDFPHLLRVWNVVPGINQEQNGLERYRQFCIGRHDAFSRQMPALGERYPSASAVGTHSGELCIYVLAARHPGVPVENPEQVSAYRYPPQYGPRSPSFSRALVKSWDDETNLFLSGTASILGHSSLHAGQPGLQTEESLRNLQRLTDSAEHVSGVAFPLDPLSTSLKAFIRNASDYSGIREVLDRNLGKDIDVLCLEADLCRKELLVEMEGVVSASLNL